ncbi:MAG: M23 family metallopeptidase [Elusimicrobiota bacterium]
MKSLRVVLVAALALAIAAPSAFAWYLYWPTSGRISSVVGWRICPFHGREYHPGTDIAAPGGRRIGSIAAGRVTSAGWAGGYGKSVNMSHASGYTSRYSHMSSISTRRGAYLASKGKVGAVGTTGSSTGNHLDFGIKRYGSVKAPRCSKGQYKTAGTRIYLR